MTNVLITNNLLKGRGGYILFSAICFLTGLINFIKKGLRLSIFCKLLTNRMVVLS